jgi:predicted ATPase
MLDPMTVMPKILKTVRAYRAFSHPESPLPTHLTAGMHPVCIITGENASGKSLVRRAIQQACRASTIWMINASMEKRGGEPPEDGAVAKKLLYGNELEESTGYCSARAFQKLLYTAATADRDNVVFLDEPDIGLADEYSAGMGVELNRFIQRTPGNTKGVFVVSHSRYLLAHLETMQPFHLHLGPESISLHDWLRRKIEPKKLEILIQKGKENWQKIGAFLK